MKNYLTLEQVAGLTDLNITQLMRLKSKNTIRPSKVLSNGFGLYDEKAVYKLGMKLFKEIETDEGLAIEHLKDRVISLREHIREMKELEEIISTIIHQYHLLGSDEETYVFKDYDKRVLVVHEQADHQKIVLEDYKKEASTPVLLLDEEAYRICYESGQGQAVILDKATYLCVSIRAEMNLMDGYLENINTFVENNSLESVGPIILIYHGSEAIDKLEIQVQIK